MGLGCEGRAGLGAMRGWDWMWLDWGCEKRGREQRERHTKREGEREGERGGGVVLKHWNCGGEYLF